MDPWYFPADDSDLGEEFVFAGVYYFGDIGWRFDRLTPPSQLPTLSNATATDITATSFRPRVTYTFS